MTKVTFLHLPAELRNKIYELVVPTQYAFTLRERYTWTGCHIVAPEPSMLAVSRQVRQETLPIFYGTNFIVSSSLDWTIKFLTSFGPTRTAMINDIRPFPESVVPNDEKTIDCVLDALRKLSVTNTPGVRALRMEAISVSVKVLGERRYEWKTLTEIEELQVVETNGVVHRRLPD